MPKIKQGQREREKKQKHMISRQKTAKPSDCDMYMHNKSVGECMCVYVSRAPVYQVYLL